MGRENSHLGEKAGPLPLCLPPRLIISSLFGVHSEPSLTGWPVSVPLQVTIEVVEDPQAEVEMDLMAEPSNRWPQGAPNWLPTKELFWPLFWGYLEGEEGRTNVKGRAPGEEEEVEEEGYPPEYSETEDQEDDDEEDDDDKEPGFSGATGGLEQGWLSPGDWAFKEPDSYGEHPHLSCPPTPTAAPGGPEWKRERALPEPR